MGDAVLGASGSVTNKLQWAKVGVSPKSSVQMIASPESRKIIHISYLKLFLKNKNKQKNNQTTNQNPTLERDKIVHKEELKVSSFSMSQP